MLLLDNFEQVVDAAPFITELLDHCPRLQVIVTSRIRLRLSEEHEYEVHPLSLPEDEDHSIGRLCESSAIQLFVTRAQAIRPDFALTGDNAAAVLEICRQVDALPLAIELAADRVSSLPPEALLNRPEPRLALLTGGYRDRPVRQRTMWNTINWSHDLLTPDEQALFRRLGVFLGGWTLDAAVAVAGLGLELDVFEGIASLADQSLVQLMANGNRGPPYTMLETIREYASMQLEASGEGAAVRDRHAAYFVQVSEQAESNLLGPHGSTWLDHLDQERDNLRAALKWMSASGTAMLPRLAGSLWRYWYARGDLMEGCDWLSIALAVDKKSSAGAECITGAALLEHCLGNEEVALAYGEASPAFYQANGDRFGTAITLYVLGKIAEDNGEYDQAHNKFNEASTLFSLDDEQAWAGLALDHLGSVAYGRGDYEEASTVLTTALELQ